MIHSFSLLPCCSSLLPSLQLSRTSAQESRQLLLHLHWLICRCFTYKIPANNRPSVFEFLWTAIEATRFQWIGVPLTDSALSIPDREHAISDAKLIIAIINMASIEIRVECDYLYKEVIQSYNESGEKQQKDKTEANHSVALRNLFVRMEGRNHG